MSSTPTDAEPKSWHRSFAVEYNNRARDLAARAREHHEDAEMNAAPAAAWHWEKIFLETFDLIPVPES